MKSVRIGNVEVTALQDAPVLMNPATFMPSHADELMAEWGHEADSRGLLPMSITSYVLRSEGKTVLVDTGLGRRRRPGYPQGQLDERLAEAGIAPGDVDVVVHTHLHIDHVGWNTVEGPNGEPEVFFPNATFVIQQAEWDYWMTPERLEMPSNVHLRECVEPLKDSGRLRFVEGESGLDGQLTFVPTPGHTPGHVALGIFSAGERAVIVGDASHHPAQLLHPDWSPQFDVDPVQSAKSRDRLFDTVADEGRVFIAGHWNYPGFGRILRLDGKRVFRAL